MTGGLELSNTSPLIERRHSENMTLPPIGGSATFAAG
jgi:hypothetical protein